MAKSRKPEPRGTTDALLKCVFKSRSYRGKHVILIHGRVYAAAKPSDISRLFDGVVKEFPGETPTLAYVPEADAPILQPRLTSISFLFDCTCSRGYDLSLFQDLTPRA